MSADGIRLTALQQAGLPRGVFHADTLEMSELDSPAIVRLHCRQPVEGLPAAVGMVLKFIGLV